MTADEAALGGMRLHLAVTLPIFLMGCAGRGGPLNADFSPPVSAAIANSLELRDRHNIPKHIGGTAIFVDSVAVHHIFAEASTIVWKDETGRWQWSQVSEIGPGGLLPMKRNLESDRSRSLTASEGEALDRLIADRKLYSEDVRTTGTMGVGAPGHVMAVVSPFGRAVISWGGRLEGTAGTIADIVLGRG